MSKPLIYLIGSLRNPEIPYIALALEKIGVEVFADWHEAGPEADSYWREGEMLKGITYKEALKGWTSQHVFSFDKKHLDRSNIGVLVLPAGKSGHLELGYVIGQGKPGYILSPPVEYDRWDQMYNFATDICFSVEELKETLKRNHLQ